MLDRLVHLLNRNSIEKKIIEIIEEQLANKDKCSLFFVYEEAKNRVSPTDLYNAAIAAGVDTDDGLANLVTGAKVLVDRTIDGLYSVGASTIYRKGE
jgi:hypothetical protein